MQELVHFTYYVVLCAVSFDCIWYCLFADDRGVRDKERQAALIHFSSSQATEMTPHDADGEPPPREENPRAKMIRGVGKGLTGKSSFSQGTTPREENPRAKMIRGVGNGLTGKSSFRRGTAPREENPRAKMIRGVGKGQSSFRRGTPPPGRKTQEPRWSGGLARVWQVSHHSVGEHPPPPPPPPGGKPLGHDDQGVGKGLTGKSSLHQAMGIKPYNAGELKPPKRGKPEGQDDRYYHKSLFSQAIEMTLHDTDRESPPREKRQAPWFSKICKVLLFIFLLSKWICEFRFACLLWIVLVFCYSLCQFLM